jgi:hypothetical protein
MARILRLLLPVLTLLLGGTPPAYGEDPAVARAVGAANPDGAIKTFCQVAPL